MQSIGKSILILLIPQMVCASSDILKGKFLIYYFGEVLGSEDFSRELSAEGRNIVKSKGNIRGKIINKEIDLEWESNLLLTKEFKAERYNLFIKSKGKEQELNLTFKKIFAELEVNKGGSKTSEKLEMEPSLIILDNNLFSHYFVLINRYDFCIGGQQKFLIFIPQNSFKTEIFLEDRGFDEIQIGNEMYRLKRLFLNIGGLTGINIWVDNRKEIIKISLSNIIEVLRTDYSPQAERIIKIINNEKNDYIEQEITFRNGNIELAGTLLLPKNGKDKYPGTIIISGSGPQDRDGNSPSGLFKCDIYKEIAIELSKNGVAVLRYDERGVGKSTGNFQTATLSDFISDAKKAIYFLKGRNEIDPDKIVLIGHSEGGIIALKIANEEHTLNQIVCMATPAKSLKEVLREQLDLIEEEKIRQITEKNQEQLFRAVESGLDWIEISGKKVHLGWYREHFQLEIPKIVARVKCPVVVLQGGKDNQVLSYHASLLAEILESNNIPFHIRRFEDLDHLFMKSTGLGLAEYFDANRRVDKEFLTSLVNFLKNNIKR